MHMVFVIIMSILSLNSAASTPSWSKCRYTALIVDITSQQLESYRAAFGKYPSSQEGLFKLTELAYLRVQPKDAWGNSLVYEWISSDHYRLIAYGADAKPGGDGFSADYVSEGNTDEYVGGCKKASRWWQFW